MKISDLMTAQPKTCLSSHTLDVAVKLMWDHDLGIVPIVDERGEIVGVVTDRDACMAAYTRGEPLHRIPCTVAMSQKLVMCHVYDTDVATARLMAKHKVRRIPVVDDERRPIGIVSLNDLALAMMRGREVPVAEIAGTLAAICEHRTKTPAATA
jgi:CBS domain-containing protein